MYTPVKPSFTIQKWGLRGSKLHRHVFVMWAIKMLSTLWRSTGRRLTAALRPAVKYLQWKAERLPFETTSRKHMILYNFDPLKPHFYIVKLGFTGVYIIFLISAQKYILWYSLEPMFWAEIWKISEIFYLKIFSFWRWNFLYIWIGVFS